VGFQFEFTRVEKGDFIKWRSCEVMPMEIYKCPPDMFSPGFTQYWEAVAAEPYKQLPARPYVERWYVVVEKNNLVDATKQARFPTHTIGADTYGNRIEYIPLPNIELRERDPEDDSYF
jgi:hypothetical protein